jgi:hypothetical protein
VKIAQRAAEIGLLGEAHFFEADRRRFGAG